MIIYKTRQEIESIRQSGQILGKAHGEVAKHVKPGVTTKFLDKIAEEFIKDHYAEPSFLGYNGFPASLCISVNEVVVHGIPNVKELVDGDIVSIDCGVKFKGYHADSAYTYEVGAVNEKVRQLLKVTKASLYEAIKQIQNGSRIGDISYAVQTYAESFGFSIVRELVGHGVGRNLHEKPDVPNFGKRGKGPKLSNGMVIAIEPMINMGSRFIVQEKDGWTIRTRDRAPSAHFEHTVAVIDGRAEVLTTFEFIEAIIDNHYA